MTKIYIARHGESDWNIINRVQGQYNSNLTRLGLEQAGKLADVLEEKKIEYIYTSDLDRAYYTGKKLADREAIEIKKDKRLRELHFGDWQEKYISDLLDDWGEDYKKWLSEPESFQIPGGESFEELRCRLTDFFKEIIKKHEGENILIVSHGVAIKMAILVLLEGPNSMHKNFSISNVGLSLIEVRDYNNVLKFYNDTGHLGE